MRKIKGARSGGNSFIQRLVHQSDESGDEQQLCLYEKKSQMNTRKISRIVFASPHKEVAYFKNQEIVNNSE